MRNFLLFTFAVLFFLSCTSKNIERTLNDVESYIRERPDSALTVLDSIDRDLLKSRKLRSHHALLFAMALDKNYIDERFCPRRILLFPTHRKHFDFVT